MNDDDDKLWTRLLADFDDALAAGPEVAETFEDDIPPEVQYAYTEMAFGVNNSRSTSITYPNGEVFDFIYNSGLDNAISRISAIEDPIIETPWASYLYLGLDTIVEDDDPASGVDLTYIRQPNETSVDTDGGDQYTGLDCFGRVVDQNWINSSEVSLVRYQYGYDRDGDVLYRADLVNTALSELSHPKSTTPGDDNTAYDGLGRLTMFSRGTLVSSGNNGSTLDKITGASSSQSWSLGALGNWSSTTSNGTTTTETFNAQDQTTEVNGSSSAAPVYDNGNSGDGNVTSEAVQTFVYDAWNRLVAVKTTSTGATLASYSYDASGDRITETYSGTVNNLYYSGGNVIEERQVGTSASNVAYQYVWGLSGNLIFRDQYSGGTVVSGDRLYALTDANGDVTAILATNAAVVERFAYSPYGQVTALNANGTPVTGNIIADGWRYLFQGGRLDTASGLYIFGARDYNPAEGTWMQRDPIGLSGGDLEPISVRRKQPNNMHRF